MVDRLARRNHAASHEATCAATLWFYAAWYLGSAIATLLGVPDLLGPILGLAAGLVVGIDPRRLIWVRASKTSPTGA